MLISFIRQSIGCYRQCVCMHCALFMHFVRKIIKKKKEKMYRFGRMKEAIFIKCFYARKHYTYDIHNISRVCMFFWMHCKLFYHYSTMCCSVQCLLLLHILGFSFILVILVAPCFFELLLVCKCMLALHFILIDFCSFFVSSLSDLTLSNIDAS